MKNNSLIKYQESFFTKLKWKFKSIFFKDNKDKNEKDNDKIIEFESKETDVNQKTISTNKEEFFKLYNKVINKEVNINSLSKEDLTKVYEILKEEVKIKRDIIAEKTKVLEGKKEILKKIVNE